MTAPAIDSSLREIDIYVFDQLIKGRFDSARRVLDAGCGEGRNLWFLMARGHDCYGIDRLPGPIDEIRAAAARLAPALPASNFVTGEIDALPWESGTMDAVICSAVLHFARDEAHFDRMVAELFRVLVPGGVFFARLASSIGIEHILVPVGPAGPGGGRRARVPDGSERFVVDEAMLLAATRAHGGTLLDPLKTTIVQQQRAMTTWVVRKG
ncbi:MAG: class I SAM-dependent methyltransferase [Acidobacteriota bacterium]|nr:class I SAM-dependent methyltransferase [Acidobacteriota bacterium]